MATTSNAMVGKLKKHVFILVCTLLMLNACGFFKKDKPPPTPEPTRVVLEFDAAGDINPNIAGRPSPLELRIYHLKSYSQFKDADFNTLYEQDDDVLGRDLVEKKKIYLKPYEKRTLFFEGSDEVRTVGILAAFRYYGQGRWKVATGVQKNKTNVIHVSIKGNNVQIN